MIIKCSPISGDPRMGTGLMMTGYLNVLVVPRDTAENTAENSAENTAENTPENTAGNTAEDTTG